MKRVIALAFTVALAIGVVTAGSIRAAGPEQDKPADEATALAVKLTQQGAQGRFILRLVLTGTQVTTFARPIPRRCGTRHRHPPYPTPTSATRHRVRFAGVIYYGMLRFSAFLKIWVTIFSTQVLNSTVTVFSGSTG